MEIKQALQYLDPNDDALWTNEGLPRLEAVATLVGRTVRRQEVTDAAPEFNRTAALHAAIKEEDVGDGAPAAAPQRGDDAPDDAVEDGKPAVPATAGASPAASLAASQQKAPTPHTAPPVAPGQRALDMPTAQVLRSLPLTQQALEELGEKIQVLAAQKRDIDEQLAKLNTQNEFLTMHMHRLNKVDHGRTQRDIGEYLERQNEVRAARAQRAKAFISGGTTIKDVQEMLRTGSKLDAAMARKTGFGNQRPTLPHLPKVTDGVAGPGGA
jgi:hypothetical protein